MSTSKFNIRDINPLEHLTSDLAKARFNYESILNGLVEWNNSKLDNVTVRLMCDTEPGIVDYTFPTKKSSDNLGSNMADPDTDAGAFSFANAVPVAAMVSEDSTFNDRLDIRTTVHENGGSQWQIWASAMLYDEQCREVALVDENEYEIQHETDAEVGSIVVSRGANAVMEYLPGQFIRVTHDNDDSSEIRWVTSPIQVGNSIDSTNTAAVFEEWSLSRVSTYSRDDVADRLFVVYDKKVYRTTGTVSTLTPDVAGSGWEYYCDVIDQSMANNFILEHGKVYLYVHPCHASDEDKYSRAELFLYNGTYTQYGYMPYEIECEETCNKCIRKYNEGWVNHSVLLTQVTNSFDKTMSFRWTVKTDIESIVLYRMTNGESANVPEIYGVPSVRIVGCPTEDNGGLAVFDTSNYAAWPASSAKWTQGSHYETDVSLGAYEKQDYTATMIFDHANPKCKQCNIINYDGPDLDMGLAIYLPVESTVDGHIVHPKNGRTMEFLFRIWPNAEYNGHETADLIINKAQIYVYSIGKVSDIGQSGRSVGCDAKLLAKFSMARLTNFYVFSENIAVPNRPVLYKAKFVYSETDQEWKTYGYYQIPDCIFLSPAGFVDPSQRSGDTYGVETAGFPMMQDPFSNYDLSPVMVDETFRNRIG